MKEKRIVVGYLEENCYILEKNGKCLIIDPGDDFFLIDKELGGLVLEAILITHGHFDHVGAVDELVDKYGVKVFDRGNLSEGINALGEFSFEVIYNPGHSSDSISFYFPSENAIFVGDFIFHRSVGRWDLETGDYSSMKKSIIKFIDRFESNPNLKIYPGHGDTTTYSKEKLCNPFFGNYEDDGK